MGIMTSLYRSMLRLPALGLAFAMGLAGLMLPAAALAEAGLSLQPSHWWMDDPNGDLPPLEALSRAGQWHQGKHAAPNRGYVDHPVWFRFDVAQQGEAREAYFEVGSAYLDRVDVYLVQWQGDEPRLLDHQQAGDHADFSERFLNGRYPLFAFAFPQPGRYSFLLRVNTRSALMFPASLQTPRQFYQSELRNQALYGLYFGMLLVLAYFNLMLLIYVREKTFLHNFLFLASIGFYQAGLSGFGNGYLWFGNVAVNDLVMVVSATCSFFFGGRFALRFMELKVRAPTLYYVGHLLISSFLVVLALAFLVSERTLVTVLQGVGLVTALYAFFVMIHQSARGNDWARYLLLGWSTTITGYCMFILAMLDLLEYNGTILFLQAAGLGLGNVMVTTAIAARVRRERREKASAIREALQLSREVAQLNREKEQLQQYASQQLQQEVEEKTRTLNQKLQSLQHSNQQLERDSLSDALTGLGNRRYLDAVFPESIRQCSQHRAPLGILVIDADHFKRVNDTFGHLAGDECLRKISTILQKYCRRNLDTLVRYGGEEFVMLLPATDLEGVLKVAESIRHHVEHAQFWFDNQRVPVTVSLGVHVGIPAPLASAEKLMHKADEALYQAKRNGRNRVEIYKAALESVKA